MINESALLIFSGGQDSATCLAWALSHFKTVHTVGFDYGQRHHVEMACRKNVLAAFAKQFENLGTDQVLNLDILGQLSETALTRELEISCSENSLPNTFVPGRNLMFLLASAALAWRLHTRNIIMGVCETDYSGYPDCRDDAIKAMQIAINIGMGSNMIIHTPLMWLTKAQTWQLAEKQGGKELVELIRTQTHTCYLGTRDVLHTWGYGCAECPACILRAKGWSEYVISC